METSERENVFESYRGEGWEEEYKDYRNKWSYYAKNQIVSEYPLLVDIELSTVCNLQCPMCYTISDEFKSKVKSTLMDYNLFVKIIDEIAGKVPAIRLSLRGESTLHPKFVECIKYAKQKGIPEVSTLTNGSKLDEDYFIEMLKAGIDWITVSVDGIEDTYENIRKPLKFNETLGKFKMMKRVKEKYGVHRPVIKVQSIWPAIRNNPGKFYNLLVPYVDFIAFNPMIDFAKTNEDIVYVEDFSCPQLYQRLVIGADGSAMMCANDEDGQFIVGDASKETIYEMWHGKPVTNVREMHRKKNGFKCHSVCSKCYLPRAMEESEYAEVNGRTFFIKNYI